MHLNGTEQLRRAIWCEIYVIRVGYIPYLKKFAKQLETEEGRNRRRSKGDQETKLAVKKLEEEEKTAIATRNFEWKDD